MARNRSGSHIGFARSVKGSSFYMDELIAHSVLIMEESPSNFCSIWTSGTSTCYYGGQNFRFPRDSYLKNANSLCYLENNQIIFCPIQWVSMMQVATMLIRIEITVRQMVTSVIAKNLMFLYELGYIAKASSRRMKWSIYFLGNNYTGSLRALNFKTAAKTCQRWDNILHFKDRNILRFQNISVRW